MLAHYSSDTFSTHIEYPSADPYSTYTVYSPADVCSDVLNDIMSSYYLHNYWIFGLNGLRGSAPQLLQQRGGLISFVGVQVFRKASAVAELISKAGHNKIKTVQPYDLKLPSIQDFSSRLKSVRYLRSLRDNIGYVLN